MVSGFYNTEYNKHTEFINNLLLVLIAILSIAYVFLVPKININWDEFLYLSKVYNYEYGRPLYAIQTIYVYFFRWLTAIPGNEAEQIIVARYVYLTLFFICLCIIYLISNKIFSKTGALFTIFLILTFSDIIRHGFSFRADLLCVFFFLISISFLFNCKISSVVISSVSLALCLLVSIKAVFYFPTYLILISAFIYQSENKTKSAKYVFLFSILSFLFAVCLYYAHAYSISQNTLNISNIVNQSNEKIVNAGSKVLWTGRIFPRKYYIERSILNNTTSYLVILTSILFAIKRFCNKKIIDFKFSFIGFSIPLLSLVFYRNAFPYFFVFLIPVGLIVANAYISELHSFMEKKRKGFALSLLFIPIIFSGLSAAKSINLLWSDNTVAQREILDVIHRMYPSPVPYIDRNQMVSSFPNVGFFMSTWGLERYRSNGVPVMYGILEERQPQLLIANSPVLRIYDNRLFGENKSIYRLLDEDYLTLRKNFIPHWGIIYVPGKIFQFDNTKRKGKFTIIIEGEYTIESQAKISIDGKIMNPGDVIFLSKDEHIIDGMDANQAILRWGNHLFRPGKLPINVPIYVGL